MYQPKTPMAIIYDFDGTLAPGRMQDRQFVPDVGVTIQDFWDEVDLTTATHSADPILSYMYVMLRKARQAGVPVHRDDLARKSGSIEFFPGVDTWFHRINHAAQDLNVNVQHFVISSGNSEIIEATPIAPHLHRIYASRFLYDENGVAVWPAVAINFTTKTQYLFRINKGALDQQDISMINEYIPRSQRAVPFENMIYIGDGETDVPCFQVITDLGGISIAVYPEEDAAAAAKKYLQDGRVWATAPTDYSQDSSLERMIINRMITLTATDGPEQRAMHAQVRTPWPGY